MAAISFFIIFMCTLGTQFLLKWSNTVCAVFCYSTYLCGKFSFRVCIRHDYYICCVTEYGFRLY